MEPSWYWPSFLLFEIKVCHVNTQPTTQPHTHAHSQIKWRICFWWRQVIVIKTCGWFNSLPILYSIYGASFPQDMSWCIHWTIILWCHYTLVAHIIRDILLMSSLCPFFSQNCRKSSPNVSDSLFFVLHNWFEFNKGNHWRMMAFIHLTSAFQKKDLSLLQLAFVGQFRRKYPELWRNNESARWTSVISDTQLVSVAGLTCFLQAGAGLTQRFRIS